MPGVSVVDRPCPGLTTVPFALFAQFAPSHPEVASQGDGGARNLSGSGNGATPVLGVGEIVPDQLTPPTTLIELALIDAPPLPSMAAVALFEFTHMPQFALKAVLPF